jgi:predicted ATPase
VRIILGAIDDALKIPGPASADTLVRLKCSIGPKSILLVLDNFDEVRAGAQVLAELQACAPHLKLLITTRTPLQLQCERIVRLDGLQLPTSTDELETSEASALFLQEASRLSVGFALHESQRQHLVTLCELVNGFPLALILAARWAEVLLCSALVEELEAGLGLDVLQTADEDLPARHRSMAAIVRDALVDMPEDGAAALAQLAKLATTTTDWKPLPEAPVMRAELPAYSRQAEPAACAA